MRGGRATQTIDFEPVSIWAALVRRMSRGATERHPTTKAAQALQGRIEVRALQEAPPEA